jgi:hypothetical protein
MWQEGEADQGLEKLLDEENSPHQIVWNEN